MRFFTCLIDAQHGIPDEVRRNYERFPMSRGLLFEWHLLKDAAILVGWNDPFGEALVGSYGDWIGVGMVRLDNRQDVEGWIGSRRPSHSDLELLLELVALHGDKYIPQCIGDIGFFAWNALTRKGIATCDPFGVRKLYYAKRNELFAFASRAEALALEERYEMQYLAELVGGCVPSPGLTVYAGVRSLPAGHLALLNSQRIIIRQYWSAYEFTTEPSWARSEGEAIATCRHLLTESVKLRLGKSGTTWSHLSGGMDSSSVVSIAQWLASTGASANGLAGTITYSYSHGTGGDERKYSDAVVSTWGVRNEKLVDPPVWEDCEHDPPYLDEPTVGLLYYPRDLRVVDIVRRAGGRVLLTGAGGDSLFAGNMFFFADWLSSGKVGPAVREMARRAAVGRASFWELAYRNALLPLLPRGIQHRLIRDEGLTPPWVRPATIHRYGLKRRAGAALSYAGPIGWKYHHCVALTVAGTAASLPIGPIEDALDVRHPYLYRPLVEFALRLPPELSARPHARKWTLRQAMDGVLPEGVRTRVGKGTFNAVLSWSLTAQAELLQPLLQEPILAALGVVDAVRMRTFFRALQLRPDGRDKLHAAMQQTLAIEAWLAMRAGRWPRGGRPSRTKIANHSYARSS